MLVTEGMINHIKREFQYYFISSKHRFMYCKLPKNAGTSIFRNNLWDAFNLSYASLQNDRAKLTIDEFRDIFKFTFVRNPYDRLISNYFYFKSRIVTGKLA